MGLEDIAEIWAPLVGIGVAFSLSIVVWNMSRKMTTVEICQQGQHNEHIGDTKRLEINLEKSRSERKEELKHIQLGLKDDLTAINIEFQTLKTEIKEISGRVNMLDQKSKYADVTFEELKKMVGEEKKFFTDWVRRVEDRINVMTCNNGKNQN